MSEGGAHPGYAVQAGGEAGLAALSDLRETLRRDNVQLVVARAKAPLVERLSGKLGTECLYPTVRAAVEACRPEAAG